MLRKTKKVISLLCALIFILPTLSYSMDKEEFLKFLIESSYPESSTKNDNLKEEKKNIWMILVEGLKMKIELMDHITLGDNRTFIVSNITKYNSKDYYLLLNFNDDSDIMIAYLDNSDLISIDDVDEYIKILKKFDTNKVLRNFSIEEIINLKENYDKNDNLQ